MQDTTAGGRLAYVAIRAPIAEATRRCYEQGLGLQFLGYRRPGRRASISQTAA